MWAEKSVFEDTVINLKLNEPKSRVIYVKERFKQLVGKRLYKFMNRKCCKEAIMRLEKNEDFELLYFSSYFECYESFRIFEKNSRFFGLSKNPRDEKNTNKTIMNPKMFTQRVDKMIEKDLEKLSDNPEKSMPYKFYLNFLCKRKSVLDKNSAQKTFKLLVKKCFDDLKSKMLKKEIFFHIGGKYNVNYYFKELYNQAGKAVKEFQEKYEIADLKYKDVIFQKICESFHENLFNLQANIIDDLFKTDFIEEQVSKIFGIDVKFPDDISNVENIIFDCLNMLTYLSDFYCISGDSIYNTFNYPLIFNTEHKCKIVSCLKIQFDTQFSNDFVKIEAFNEKGGKVEFNRNVHYALKFNSNWEIYCTLEVLNKLNIKKIKIAIKRKKLCKTIELNKYLSN
ncbi:hypothetical protein NBO_28g0042 [Nosema bombycis CQ1]|uniref:Uncharacterized protein n=1 Tax=Nosema bombycis (strain CQ1 / CVCC 102059) TaxID=578461 RepID=R0MNI3_NOSB1|nr:hypothetical protein NBO_28g0042 [Nosema bombycis CQ1]|eukprot:EOB14403.1 hypothetical protein NBO_28g0042 [Nosema bombycis CQ1]